MIFYIADLNSQYDYSFLHDIYAGKIVLDDTSYSVRLEINTTTHMMYGAIERAELSSPINLKRDKMCFKKVQLFKKEEFQPDYIQSYIDALNSIRYYSRKSMNLYFYDKKRNNVLKLRKVD